MKITQSERMFWVNMKAQGHRSSGACDKANMGPEDTCDSGGILEGKIPKRRAAPKRITHFQGSDCKLSWEKSYRFSFF